MNYEKLSKKALLCMYISAVVELVIVAACVVACIVLVGDEMPEMLKNVLIGALIVNVIYCIVAPKIRYERYRYAIDENGIDIKEGLYYITREIVPIERLHKISVKSGPIDRICGLGKVIVTTAGGDVTIRFLEDEKAAMISESLKKRINTIAVQRRQ